MKASVPSAAAGMIDVGGELTVARLGYDAMRLTGPGVWGEPPDRDRAERVTPVVSVQNRYNAVDRSSEAMVDLCEQETLMFLPWAPVHYTEASRAGLELSPDEVTAITKSA
jgi:aryl-alcohol dehydrogenase-like predicted oxidoreductase